MAEYTRESIKAACMYHSLYFKIARRVYDVMDFEIILPLTITTIIFILAHVIIKHQLKIQLFFFLAMDDIGIVTMSSTNMQICDTQLICLQISSLSFLFSE